MAGRRFFTSTTRISDLRRVPFKVSALPRSDWATADYVVGKVTGRPSVHYLVEQDTGRMSEVMPGDEVIGVFGQREATLEAVGSWEAIADDDKFEAMTSAGLFGKTTSIAPYIAPLMSLKYFGHVLRNNRKLGMVDFVSSTPEIPLRVPVIMLTGTSMSAGKTTTGRIIIHELKAMGLKVAAGKFTGAARYRDILSFKDAGADYIMDFTEAGLPSTVCPPATFRSAMTRMMSQVAAWDVDVLVAEAGASPMEPYNGDIALEFLKPQICMSILCASDPYAVVGVRKAFGMQPDLVSGPAANTQAGIELVARLSGSEALCLLEPANLPVLRTLLKQSLDAA